jgi:O-6-methylguanine DNA methyltransferase
VKAKSELTRLPIATTDGEFVAGYSDKGLAFLNFPTGKRRALSDEAAPPQVRRWHEMTTTALKRTLAGQDTGQLPPLDDSAGTDFQRSVWRAMRRIQSGHTSSYGEIAKAIGKPNAVRAVGGACGANPIPVLVPCHRVLAAHQKIGGFSGGLDWKRKLLAREGAVLF